MKPSIKRSLIIFASVVLILGNLFLILSRLNNESLLWWDEGWTLDAARNWVEKGHLGHYLSNEPIPVRIPVRFSIVTSIALSMKFFGVGIWQGRLVIVGYTILALLCLFYLTTQMYNLKIGIVTIISLLVLSPYDYHPFTMGGQVLAELPMMFYLLAGYCFLWLAMTRSSKWGFGAALIFGVAIHSKLQVPPFWAASIISAIAIAWVFRQRRLLRILITVAAGSVISAIIIYGCQNKIMPGSFSDPALTKILFNTVVFAFSWPIRFTAIQQALLLTFPQMVGFLWVGINNIRFLVKKNIVTSEKNDDEFYQYIMRIMIWVLGASWLVWFIGMSISWSRYLFPPFFIGSIFSSAYIYSVTSGLNFSHIVRQASALILHRIFTRQNIQAILLIIVGSFYLGFSILSMRFFILVGKQHEHSPSLTAEYLTMHIPAGSIVETFESELLFVAPQVNFHYPTDLVSMQLVRRVYFDPDLIIDYDPMEFSPDYLVIGQYSEAWHTYEEVLDKGWFELETQIGDYYIYKNSQAP